MFMKGRDRARVFLYRGVRDIKADEKHEKTRKHACAAAAAAGAAAAV